MRDLRVESTLNSPRARRPETSVPGRGGGGSARARTSTYSRTDLDQLASLLRPERGSMEYLAS